MKSRFFVDLLFYLFLGVDNFFVYKGERSVIGIRVIRLYFVIFLWVWYYGFCFVD